MLDISILSFSHYVFNSCLHQNLDNKRFKSSRYIGSNFIKRVLENVIKRAFGKLSNIIHDKFNKSLSRQSTDVRFFLLHN